MVLAYKYGVTPVPPAPGLLAPKPANPVTVTVLVKEFVPLKVLPELVIATLVMFPVEPFTVVTPVFVRVTEPVGDDALM